MRLYAFSRAQEVIHSPLVRSRVSLLTAKLLNRTAQVEVSGELRQSVKQLDEIGWLSCTQLLADHELREFTEELSGSLCRDRWRKNEKPFLIDNAPHFTHSADIIEVEKMPRALDIANDPAILDIVEGYLGVRPSIDGVKAWWSLAGHDLPEQEQFFHRDHDSLRFLKLFVYLSDVTESDGPHVYVETSHKKNQLTDRRRFSDQEVTDHFGTQALHTHVGRFGTAFLEDTYGVHKGELPKVSRRLIFQVRYSGFGTIFRNTTRHRNIQQHIISKGYDAFVNRNFL